jgi:hypothetical protein
MPYLTPADQGMMYWLSPHWKPKEKIKDKKTS